MPTIVDLSALGAQGFVAVGDGGQDYAGWSVSDAGDVNGDGFGDIIVGSRSGQAHVIFGQAGGFGTVDLGNLQPAEGFRIESSYGHFPGLSVSAAGDVNGDGFDDIVVGGFSYSWYYYGSSPSAYVIYGKGSGFGTIDVYDLAEAEGFQILGALEYSYDGLFVASAGDVNGDGFDDVIVGSPYENDGAGAVYVIFGKASSSGVVDLTSLPSSAGFKIIGQPDSGDFAGRSVSGAGDVNGDGFDDIIIGTRYGNNGGLNAGEAYVIFGKASGFGTVDLSNLAAGAGFVIQGDEAGDHAGWSVSGAGDVNGDRFDDIIISAAYGDDGGTHAGEAYVIFGTASGFGPIDLSSLAPGAGFIIRGDDTGDYAGWSVSAGGDVNGDGLDDIIVGAPGNDNIRSGSPRIIDAGEAYVIFGKASGFTTIDLTNLGSSDGFIIQGEAADDLAGWSVSAAGDVDGDGFDDLIIGAPYNDRTGTDAGAVYIISGRQHFSTEARNDFNGDGRSDVLWRHDNGQLTEWLGMASGGFADNGSNAFSNVSNAWRADGIGDFNGDGRDDILWRHDNGHLTEWLGKPNGGFIDNGSNASYAIQASWSVAGIGDFNGDGRDDILLRHDNGHLTQWLGKANGGFIDNGTTASYAIPTTWSAVGTGDFNGDGRDDILWRHDNGLVTEWLGTSSGAFVDNGTNAARSVSTAWKVAGIGDFNGDGRDDILWRHDNGHLTEWLGAAGGGFIDNGANAFSNVSTSWQIDSIGDFNGDGRDDILWRHDNGQLTGWSGTASGGFSDNGANASGSVSTAWQVQEPEMAWW